MLGNTTIQTAVVMSCSAWAQVYMLMMRWVVCNHCRRLVVQNDKHGSGAIEHGLYLQACKTGFCQTRAHISFAMTLKSMKKSVSSVSERSGATPQTQYANSLFERLLPAVVHVCSTGFRSTPPLQLSFA